MKPLLRGGFFCFLCPAIAEEEQDVDEGLGAVFVAVRQRVGRVAVQTAAQRKEHIEHGDAAVRVDVPARMSAAEFGGHQPGRRDEVAVRAERQRGPAAEQRRRRHGSRVGDGIETGALVRFLGQRHKTCRIAVVDAVDNAACRRQGIGLAGDAAARLCVACGDAAEVDAARKAAARGIADDTAGLIACARVHRTSLMQSATRGA